MIIPKNLIAISGNGGGDPFTPEDYGVYESVASVTLNSNTFTKIPISQSVGAGNLGSIVNSDFVVPEDGFYRACGLVPHDGGNSNGHRRGGIYVDNQTSLIPPADEGGMVSSGSAPPIEGVDNQVFTCTLELTAGQTLSLYGWQNTGVQKDVVAGAWMGVTRLGASAGVSEQLPKLTTTQRNTLVNPPTGYAIFNTDTEEQQTKVTEGWYCHKKMSIGCGSNDTIVASSDPLNPSYCTGLVGGFLGFTLTDQATGTFQNTSGRHVQSMTGTISFRPEETGGGTGILQFVSESSSDGVSWTLNPNSLRTVEVPANGESFATKVSFLANIPNGNYFRFRFYEAGAGGVTLSPTTDTILGQVINSSSIVFELTEQYTIDS